MQQRFSVIFPPSRPPSFTFDSLDLWNIVRRKVWFNMKSALGRAWQDFALLVNYIEVVWKVGITCHTLWRPYFGLEVQTEIISIKYSRSDSRVNVLRLSPWNRWFSKIWRGHYFIEFIEFFCREIFKAYEIISLFRYNDFIQVYACLSKYLNLSVRIMESSPPHQKKITLSRLYIRKNYTNNLCYILHM